MSGLITKVNADPGETGYELQLSESKVAFLHMVKSQVSTFPKNEQYTGGKVAYIYLYKVPAAAAGNDRLSFVLRDIKRRFYGRGKCAIYDRQRK